MSKSTDSMELGPRRPKHPAFQNLDPTTRFLYTPRTITGLFIGFLLVVYFSRTFNPPPAKNIPEQDAAVAYGNVKHGLIAMVMVWLGYSFLQGPTTCMVRPHPGLWRLVHGVLIVYLLGLVFLLFQNVDDARQLFRHLDPELGVQLPERAYGTDCRLHIPGKGINWEVIRATVCDEFVLAHTLGWWAKAVVLRNRLLLWTLSIGFELMELTFQHMLPNFNECWWDSWVLDVLLCNWLGIFVGMRTVRWFGSREYNWSGLSQQPSLLAKARRSLLQFSPYSWDDFDWRVTSSPARLLLSLLPVLLFLLFEVNAFFLKYILWIPSRNLLNTYRLILLFFLALPSVKEYYTFIESDESDVFTKLGPFAWLGTAIALAETLICIKFSKGMFPNPWPARVLVAWGLSLSGFAAAYGLWCYRYYFRGYRHGVTCPAPHAKVS